MFKDTQLGRTMLQWMRAAFSAFVSQQAGGAHYEVERKFRLQDVTEALNLNKSLLSLGFVSAGLATMSDSFLPGALPGEMLRIRREQIDGGSVHTIFTFKQWVETSSGTERQETERTVQATIASIWLVVGRLLNGGPLLGFSKKRHLYDGKLDGMDCVVSVDDVEGLGQYSGWYMEVEVLMPLGEETAHVRERILALTEQIIGEPRADERRSYRDMLLESMQA